MKVSNVPVEESNAPVKEYNVQLENNVTEEEDNAKWEEHNALAQVVNNRPGENNATTQEGNIQRA